MRFTIDLLKGQGIPIRRRPESIAVASVTIAVPLLVAILMLGYYLRTRVTVAIQEREVIGYQTKIVQSADALELQKSFEREQDIINKCLSEVASSIGRHEQWSPLVAAIVTNIPDSVVLTRLEVRQRFVNKKAPSKDNPEQMVDVSIPVRTLAMNVCGSGRLQSDKAVRNFRDKLRNCPLLGSKLDNIRVSQKSDRLDGRDVVNYEISCDFKAQLQSFL